MDQPVNLKHFYGEITGMDRALGKLREELKKMEDYENTIYGIAAITVDYPNWEQPGAGDIKVIYMKAD